MYFLALVIFDTHERAVPHLQPVGFYEALLEGRDYVPKISRKRASFDFGATTHPYVKRVKASVAGRGRGRGRGGRRGRGRGRADFSDEEASVTDDGPSEQSDSGAAESDDR